MAAGLPGRGARATTRMACYFRFSQPLLPVQPRESTMLSWVKWTMLIILLMVIVACGGGGSGDSAPAQHENSQTVIKGRA